MASGSKWKLYFNSVLNEVWHLHKNSSAKVFMKAVRDAYPLGERSSHPYKVWLAERKKFVLMFNKKHEIKTSKVRKSEEDQNLEGQLTLF